MGNGRMEGEDKEGSHDECAGEAWPLAAKGNATLSELLTIRSYCQRSLLTISPELHSIFNLPPTNDF